jgi:redox-sensitive bicupin YhaK (pirin superfamily)
MSNGTGIWHTEGNAGDVPNRYIQIWIDTAVKDTEPNYSNYTFSKQDRDNRFFDITSVLPIHQDAKFYSGIFTEEHQFTLNPQRRYYLYVVSGTATINRQASVEGDGCAFRQEIQLNIIPTARSEIILFDLR